MSDDGDVLRKHCQHLVQVEMMNMRISQAVEYLKYIGFEPHDYEKFYNSDEDKWKDE